jgi:hypothetical protein
VSKKREHRDDRYCERCGAKGAALLTEDAESLPIWLCDDCINVHEDIGNKAKDLVRKVQQAWLVSTYSKVTLCPICREMKVEVYSNDGNRYFRKCGCGTVENTRESFFGGFRFF